MSSFGALCACQRRQRDTAVARPHRRRHTTRDPRPCPRHARSNQLEKIPDDIISDPSLTREKNIVCPKCQGHEAIFIQAKATPSDDRMKLIFVCTNVACIHKWQG